MNNTKTMTRTQLDILYRVMMKRIAKNFSAEKLSFLIGRKADYVTNVEMLETDPYSIDDLACIAAALEEEDIENFYPLGVDDSDVHVRMVIELVADKYNYTCTLLNTNLTEQPYFFLQEYSAEAILIAENNDYDAILATSAIAVQIKAGCFFESQSAVKVYQSINRFLGLTLSPTYIENALNSFCTQDNDAVLQKQQNGSKRFVYIEA